jgi:hypothetical protein
MRLAFNTCTKVAAAITKTLRQHVKLERLLLVIAHIMECPATLTETRIIICAIWLMMARTCAEALDSLLAKNTIVLLAAIIKVMAFAQSLLALHHKNGLTV